MVFCDTEFSTLESPQLLSLGLVSEFGDECYIELANAQEMIVSDFVRHEVLPLFGLNNPLVLENDAVAAHLEVWFDKLREGDRDIGIVLITDYPVDWMLIAELRIPMPEELPWTRVANVGGRMVQHLMTSGEQMGAYFKAVEEFHRAHKQRHHALVDARAMKYAYDKARLE